MGRSYDIIARLKAKNERPFVRIDEEHAYNINTSKTNVMSIMAMYDNHKDDKNVDSIKLADKTIEMALGKEALEYINSKQMTNAATMVIVNAIMAGIADMDLEEAEEKEKSRKK